MGVGVVEAAAAVLFVDPVHRLLQLHAARVVAFWEERRRVTVGVRQVGEGDADFGGFGHAMRVLRPEIV